MGVNTKSTLVPFAVAVLLVANAVAGPLDRRGGQCARQCTEDNKFKYEPGTTYTYNYEATTLTTMQGTTREESRLHLKAFVDLEVISKCEFSLKLRGVTLEQSDPRNPNARMRAPMHDTFQQQLERNVIRFSYQDGRIEDVCAPEQEEPFVLNIKRGILSSFQTSMHNLDVAERVIETDVAGRCAAEYESLGRNWNAMTIRRTKDLTACTERESAKTMLQATPYIENKASKSQPLVKGNQICTQSFRHDKLYSCECTENHILRPFSKQANGAITTATSKLTFSSQEQGKIAGNDYLPTRTGMLFQHEESTRTDAQRKRDAELVLRELCVATNDDVRPEVPRLFARLVYKMRDVDYSGLQNIFQKIDTICDNKMIRKFFLDALPIVGTTDSVKLMREMIRRKIISDSEADAYMSAIAFIPKPNVEMIASLTPLLDGNFPDALLHVSTMIYTFCRNHGDCGSVPEVQNAVRQIVQILGESCYGRDRRTVLLALKAIGNIGLGFEVSNTLQRCYSNPQNDIEIRLAAIQAFRRFSCDISRQHLLSTYSNFNENTELRIAAYLAVMHCPSAMILNKIQQTMEKEPINQVGAYVFSHLMNQEHILTPYKKELKSIVTDLYLLNKFHTDIRKFSHNFHKSFFMKSLDSGADLEADLIYSPESFLPRSGMFNLTFDLFGNSVNLFEVGGRFEGFERYLESLFGPAGYLSDNSIYKMLREVRKKRSIADNKIEEIEEKFNAKSRFTEEPSGSIYMKLFGNEMFYNDFRGLGVLDKKKEAVSIIETLLKMLNEKDVEYTKSIMFLDTTYTIPLGTGLPLRLAVNGTATIHLAASGKFDIRSFNDADIRAKLQPSGAIEISSLMSVDARVAKTGIKMVATLHSSTHLDGLVEVKNGQMVRVQFNVPRDKMEVIDIQSRIFMVHGGEEREQQNVNSRGQQVSMCSGAYTSHLLGMELCSDLQVPSHRRDSPLFPMNGPATFRVYLRKTDPTLTTYNFDASISSERAGKNRFIRRAMVSFNTPQSTTDREMVLDAKINELEKSLDVKLRTPFKMTLGMKAKFNNEKTQKKFDLSFIMNDREQFSMQSELSTELTNSGSRYTPFLEIRIPSKRVIYLKGHASVRDGQKYIGQLSIEDLTEKPIVVAANVDFKEKDRCDAEFSLTSGILDTSVKGYFQTGKNLASQMTLEYRFQDNPKEKFDFTAKFRDLSANSLCKYSGALSIQSTALPEYSTSMNFEIQKTNGYWEKSLEINMGDGVRSRIHTINILEIVNYQFYPGKGNLLFTISMKYPQKNMDYAFTIKHEHSIGSLSNRLNVVYGPGKEFVSLVELALEKSSKLQAKGDFKVQYPGREIILSGKVDETQPKTYEATLTCQLQRGKSMKALATYSDKSDRTVLSQEFLIEITMPRRKPISVTGSVMGDQNRYSVNGALDFGRDKYSIIGEYNKMSALNHRILGKLHFPGESYSTEMSVQGGRDSFVANMDVRLGSNKQIAAKTELRRIPEGGKGSVDIMLDVPQNKNKRYILEAEYKNVQSGLQGSFTFKCPERNVRGSFNTNSQGKMFSRLFRTNSHAEIEFEPNKKFSIDFTVNSNLQRSRRNMRSELFVTTPFRGYESTGVSFLHNDDGENFNCQVVLSCPHNNKISMAANGRYTSQQNGQYFHGSFRLNSPFRNFETLRFDIGHERSPSEFFNKIDLQYAPSKTVSGGIYVSLYGNEGFRAGLNFSSPFQEVRDFNSAVSFSFVKDIRAQCEISLNNKKQLTVDFTGSHELSGRKRTCTTELQMTTTVEGFERIVSNVDYVNDGSEVIITGNFYCNDRRLTTSFSGSRSQSGKRQELNGKFFLETPFRNLNKLLMTASHSNDKEKFQNAFDFEVNDQKIVSLNAKGSMPSINDIQGMITLQTTFRDFEQLSAELNHKVRGKSLQSTVQFASGSQKITVVMSGSYASRQRSTNLNGNLIVTTPFRNYEQFKFGLSHDLQDDAMNTRVELAKNRQSIIIMLKSNAPSFANFEHSLEISTPFRTMQSARAFIMQNYNDNQFRQNIEIEKNREKITLTTAMEKENPRYGNKFSAMTELITPFESLKTLKIHIAHKDDTREFRPELFIQYNKDNMKLLGFWRQENFMFDSKITLTSTFQGYESAMLSAKYNLNDPRKNAEVSYLLGNDMSNMFSVKGYFEATPKVGEVKLNIDTPIKEMRRNILFMRYRNQNREKEMLLEGESDSSKISISAQTTIHKNSIDGTVSIMTPFAKFEKLVGTVSCGNRNGNWYLETSVQKNTDSINCRIDYKGKTGEPDLQITFRSSIPGYENLSFKATANVNNPKKTFNMIYQGSVNKKIELNCDFHVETGKFFSTNMEFQSPFSGYEDIKMVSRFSKEDFSSNGLFKLQLDPRRVILAIANINYGDSFPRSVTFNLDTPFSPITTIKFTGTMVPQKDQLEINMNLELEKSRKINVNMFVKKQGTSSMEGKFSVETPFNNFRKLSLDGNLQNDNFQYIDGKVSVITPFAAAENFALSGTFRSMDGYQFLLNMETPEKKITISSSFKNKGFNPALFEFSLDAPFTSFKTFTITTNLNIENSRIQAGITAATLETKHTFSGSYQYSKQNVQGEFNMETPLISAKRMTLRFEVISDLATTLTGSLNMETPSTRHLLAFNFLQDEWQQEIRGDLSLDTPFLQHGQAKMSIHINNRFPNKFDAEFSSTIFAQNHNMKVSLTSNSRQVMLQINIQCPFMSARPIKIEGKYMNSYDGVREAMFMFSATTSHTAKITLNTYNNENEVQINIDSPLFSFKTLTISGNYRNINSEAMEGALSISTPSKELRIAGNMKRKEMNEFDGFVTLNTPFENFRMARVDVKYSNTHHQTFDASLNIETSLRSFRSMSAVAKIRRNKALDDMSINMKLPFQKYREVGLLSTMHYNRNSISPKITLTADGERYSLFGNYRHLPGDFYASLGCELSKGQKFEIETEAKYPASNIEAQILVSTPFRGHEKYSANFNFNNDRRRIVCQATFEYPTNKIAFQGNLGYSSFPNFDAKIDITTPFEGYEALYIFVRQQYSTNQYRFDAEQGLSRRNKIVLNIKNGFNRTHHEGQFIFNSPFSSVREVKASYGYGKDSYNNDGSVDLSYNGRMLFRAEANSNYKPATKGYDKTLLLDIPEFPLTVSYVYNHLTDGGDVTFKTVFPTRTSAFHATLQKSPNRLSHSAEFILDERTKSMMSYEVRLTNGKRSENEVTEFFGRINFPLRSLELRGHQVYQKRGRNINVDFFFDAAKDTSKKLSLAFEHTYVMNRKMTMHKIQLSGRHPRLNKPITATCEISATQNEVYGKTEVEYSLDQRHNFLFEGRLKNTSPYSGSVGYSMEVSVRHPVSNLETTMNGEIVNNKNIASVNLQMDHLDRNRRHKIQELRAKIEKVKQQIEILMKAGNNHFTVRGEMFSRDQQFAIVTEHKVNDGFPVHSFLRLNKANNNMDLNITTSSDSGLHLRAAFPHDAFVMQMMHTSNGQAHSDVSVNIGLVKSRLLRTRINVRPEMMDEFKEMFNKKYNDMSNSLNMAMDDMGKEMNNEANSKTMLISRSAKENMSPFYDDVQRELNAIHYDYNRAKRNVHQMYNRNELYMKDITEGVASVMAATGNVMGSFFEAIGDGLVKFGNFIENCSTYLADKISIAMDELAEMYTNIIHNTAAAINKMQITLARMFDQALVALFENAVEILNKVFIEFPQWFTAFMAENMPFLRTGYNYMREIQNAMVDKITGFIGKMMDTIYENAYTQLIIDYLREIRRTFEEFRKEITIAQMHEKLIVIYDSIPDASSITEPIIYYYDNIRTHPNVQYIGELTNKVYEQSIQAYIYLGLDNILTDLMDISYKSIKDAVFNFIHQVTNEYTSMTSGIRYDVNMQRGSILIDIPLPSERNTLYEAINIVDYPAVQNIMRAAKAKYIWHDEFSIYDGFYAFKNHMRKYHPLYWIPPFSGRAMIGGKQHFKTFDDFYFEFAGECSYLLAHDFVDRNFSIAVNYARDGRELVKKSLTILSDGHQIEVSPDYKVSLDNTRVELPLAIGKTTVRREDGTIFVNNMRGFEVECNFVHDVCTVDMSGFYFGKTGGLFGTYDYEPKLDMMTPERTLVESITEFANSYEVGTAVCRRNRNFADTMTNNLKAEDRCRSLFKKFDSLFRPCFKQVSPDPFMTMCLNDLSTVSESKFDEKICTSAYAYRSQCGSVGVSLRMPQSCVRCEKHDGSFMNEGEMITITKADTVQSADVVYIVEEKACNSETSRMLSKLARGIEDNFQANAINSVRHAVVGFGGSGVHADPHVHTADGQIFGGIRFVDSAFNSLTTGDGPNNILEALRYAAALPFRAGASRTFVLLKCSACQAEELKADYSEVLRTLLDGDITLHILMDHEFMLKKSKKAPPVFGVDKQFAYTVKYLKELRGDSDLLLQTRIPKDFCVPLALEVNGTIFTSNKLTETKRNTNKKFIDIFGQRLTQHSGPSECQICECIATDKGVGKSACQRCVSRVVSQTFSPDFSEEMGGLDGFDSSNEANDDEELIKFKRPKTKKLKKVSNKRRQQQQQEDQ